MTSSEATMAQPDDSKKLLSLQVRAGEYELDGPMFLKKAGGQYFRMTAAALLLLKSGCFVDDDSVVRDTVLTIAVEGQIRADGKLEGLRATPGPEIVALQGIYVSNFSVGSAILERWIEVRRQMGRGKRDIAPAAINAQMLPTAAECAAFFDLELKDPGMAEEVLASLA